jgi:hypothetical protein
MHHRLTITAVSLPWFADNAVPRPRVALDGKRRGRVHYQQGTQQSGMVPWWSWLK